MPNFNPYSNNGVVVLEPEASAGAAIVPTQHLRIINESLFANFANQEINEVAGDRERRKRSVGGQIEVGGDIEFLVEPNMIGHFLRSVLGAPTTVTLSAAEAFKHDFGVSDDPKSYTIDVQVADAPWVHRFFGAYATKVEFGRLDNAIKATVSVVAMKAFISARVKTAASSGTTLIIDQTSGLTNSDTILVIKKADDGYSSGGGYTTVKELAITTVDSETQLTTATIDTQIDIGDIVVIKRAVVTDSSYNMLDPFTFQGGTELYTGVDVDNTVAECKEDITISLMNEVEARHCSGLNQVNRFASDILIKGFTAEGQITKFYDNQSYIDRARENAELGVRVLMQGETALHSNAAVIAKTFWGTGNGFSVAAPTAGKAGNDYNVTIVLNDTDDLAASISGKNVLIELANSTSSKNTGTLIAAAVDSLAVDSVVEGAGTEEITVAVANTNLGDTVSGATAAVVGQDDSEKPYLQFDFAAAIPDSHEVSNSEDEIVTEEIPLKFYKDIDASDPQNKGYSVKVRLINAISSY